MYLKDLGGFSELTPIKLLKWQLTEHEHRS